MINLVGLTMMLTLFISSVSFSIVDSSSEKRLITMLLENYRQSGVDGRPVLNNSRTLPVNIGFSLLQIVHFDQQRQIISVVGWISLQWKDALLRWKAHEFDNIYQVVLNPGQIWTPDIVLFNAVSPPRVIHNTKLIVSQSGEAIWVSHVQYELTCVTSPVQDESECDLKFGSWTLNTNMLRLTSVSDRLDLTHYVPHLEWDLTSSSVTVNEFEYPCCPGVQYGDVTYSFTLRRRKQASWFKFKQDLASSSSFSSGDQPASEFNNYRTGRNHASKIERCRTVKILIFSVLLLKICVFMLERRTELFSSVES